MMILAILTTASSNRLKNRVGGILATKDVEELRYTVRTHSSRKLTLEIEKDLNVKSSQRYSTRQEHPRELLQARARTLRN